MKEPTVGIIPMEPQASYVLQVLFAFVPALHPLSPYFNNPALYYIYGTLISFLRYPREQKRLDIAPLVINSGTVDLVFETLADHVSWCCFLGCCTTIFLLIFSLPTHL